MTEWPHIFHLIHIQSLSGATLLLFLSEMNNEEIVVNSTEKSTWDKIVRILIIMGIFLLRSCSDSSSRQLGFFPLGSFMKKKKEGSEKALNVQKFSGGSSITTSFLSTDMY